MCILNCTMHYMLGFCLHPPGLFYNDESFGFGGLSLCKKALQAVGEYISHEVKNLHVYTCVCYLLMEQKELVLFVFCAKVSNAQDTS